MTVEECAQFCFQGDYSFFSLQNSDQCFCDFEIGINSVQVSSSQCNMVCADDSSEICGGSSVVSLFGGPTTLFFQYSDQGCFSYSSSIRALSGTSLLGNSDNSVEACAAFCLPTYSLFGVENGQDCWCGNSINSQAQTLPEISCNTNCTEPDGSVCGGSSAIEIYGIKTSFTVSSTSTSTSMSSTIQSSSSSSTTTTQSSSSSTSSSPSSTPTSPTYCSWGCYTEATNIRALSEAALVNYMSMTVEICANFCLVQQGQQLFGVEYGGECYCGDTLNTDSASTMSSDCNMPCGGNAAELCGAGNRLNFYGLSKPSTPTSTSATSQPTGYTYQGCYTEATNSRALDSGKLEYVPRCNSMTQVTDVCFSC
jgi:hypothetical protein